MATFKSKTALGLVPVVSLNSAVGHILYEYVAPTAALAANDIIVMGPLEANVKPLNATLFSDDLDSNGAPTITLTVGILNAALTDIDVAATAAWITASTAAQAGGVSVASSANCYLSGSSGVARQIGVKVVAGPATWGGAGKKIAVLLLAAG